MESATGESLLERLAALFEKDPLVDEVGLLFGIEAEDLTPESAFFLQEHKLGVAFKAGVPLFLTARTRFHPLNALLQSDAAEMLAPDSESRAQLLHCTRAILLISADFYTAWNTRKAFVCRGWLDTQGELQFTDLVFSLHPKSIDTWAYRRWLAIRQYEALSGRELESFFQHQVAVCGRLAEQKPRNYHAWSFRHWIVSHFPVVLLQEELVAMERWCRSHLTDHSGWNHRQHTLNELIKRYKAQVEDDKSKRIEELVLGEYKLLSGIMAPYPEHEALWCHRRFVAQWLLQDADRKESDREDAAPEQPVLQLVRELDARICCATSSPVEIAASPAESELLSAAWGRVHAILTDARVHWEAVVSVLLQEIEASWHCGTRYSRRYAVWCLERLRRSVKRRAATTASKLHEELAWELRSLDANLRRCLAGEDQVLQDMWRHT